MLFLISLGPGILSLVCAYLSGIATEEGEVSFACWTGFAAVAFLLIAIASSADLKGNQRYEDGLREASIQCTTSECPYQLRRQSDSSEVWVKIDD